MSLSFPERLLFIGIISNADDEGRIAADPRHLRAKIFPADNPKPSVVMSWRAALCEKRLAVVYTVEGIEYLYLPNWKKYQYISRPCPSSIPPPNSVNPHGVLSEHSVNPPAQESAIGIGIGGGTGKEPSTSSSGVNIFKLFENCIGLVPSALVEELKDAETHYPPEYLEYAFKQSADYNKRSWKYVLGILARCEQEGIGEGKSNKGEPIEDPMEFRQRYAHMGKKA